MNSQGGDPSGWPTPDWTVESDQKFNQQYSISTTILSCTAPGAPILPTPKGRAALARQMNEYAARLRDESPPGRYGFFASLPSLLDGDLVFEELAYAMDVLKADGVVLLTRYGDGNHYLGHPDFANIWAELDRREAVVLVHPTHPVSTVPFRAGLPQPVMEYPLETTKAAVDMLFSNIIQTHRNIKVILSHAGGTLPYVINRPAARFTRGSKEYEEWMDAAADFYFDVALSANENPLTLLQKFTKPGRILWGSDTPFAPEASIAHNAESLDDFKFERPKMLEEISTQNALELFPRLKQYYR